MGKTFVLIG